MYFSEGYAGFCTLQLELPLYSFFLGAENNISCVFIHYEWLFRDPFFFTKCKIISVHILTYVKCTYISSVIPYLWNLSTVCHTTHRHTHFTTYQKIWLLYIIIMIVFHWCIWLAYPDLWWWIPAQVFTGVLIICD